jgi:hypothetical protein
MKKKKKKKKVSVHLKTLFYLHRLCGVELGGGSEMHWGAGWNEAAVTSVKYCYTVPLKRPRKTMKTCHNLLPRNQKSNF